MAADSMTPLPSALATWTLPATTAIDEAGDAEEGVAAEFERVAEVVVDAAQDDVDLLEAADGFEVDAAVADGEVGAFDEGEAEVFGEVGVLEVGLVVRAGGEQDDARIGACGRCPQRAFALGAEKGREAQHVGAAEELRQQVRDDEAISSA